MLLLDSKLRFDSNNNSVCEYFERVERNLDYVHRYTFNLANAVEKCYASLPNNAIGEVNKQYAFVANSFKRWCYNQALDINMWQYAYIERAALSYNKISAFISDTFRDDDMAGQLDVMYVQDMVLAGLGVNRSTFAIQN